MGTPWVLVVACGGCLQGATGTRRHFEPVSRAEVVSEPAALRVAPPAWVVERSVRITGGAVAAPLRGSVVAPRG